MRGHRVAPLFVLFALVVGASLAACAAPESDGARPDPTQCASCHTPEYQGARDHAGVKPTTCGICHAQSGWHPSRIDHPWPLEGAHAKVKCEGCHGGEPTVFRGTPKACIGCHQKDFDHGVRKLAKHASFSATCTECHTLEKWVPTLPEPPVEDAGAREPEIEAGAPPVVVDAGHAAPPKKKTPPHVPTSSPTWTAAPTSTWTSAPTTQPTNKPPDVHTGASRR